MSRPLLQPHARSLRPVLEAFVPSAADLGAAEFEACLALSERTVEGRPEALQRQVDLAVTALLWLIRLRFLRPPARVSVPRLRRFLDRLQDAPVLKVRLAVWGVRTLLFAGYYGDGGRQQALGYRPRPEGWDALRRKGP